MRKKRLGGYLLQFVKLSTLGQKPNARILDKIERARPEVQRKQYFVYLQLLHFSLQKIVFTVPPAALVRCHQEYVGSVAVEE